MPRWLHVMLCLVLFKVCMTLIWLVLREVVPPVVSWLDAATGEQVSAVLIFGSIAVIGAVSHLSLWRARRRAALPVRL